MTETARPARDDDVIFALLDHRRLTQSWLAEALGVDNATITRTRAGDREFTRAERLALASIFALPLWMLYPNERGVMA